MTTARRFSYFDKEGKATFVMREVPSDGLCISAFLVITEVKNPKSVLMGHLNPEAPWDHIGALDHQTAERHRTGWMLPSTHLILLESPQAAAQRILKEQLEIQNLELSGPTVFSDVYELRGLPGSQHWDLGFIFRGSLSLDSLPKPKAWAELKFVDLTHTRRDEIARSHEDILSFADLTFF